MFPRLAWQVYRARHAPGWRPRLAVVERVARGSKSDLDAFVGKALSDHLDWAVTTIPWHKARVRPGAPIEAFPILSRAALQEGFRELRDPTRPESAMRAEASGGSTGEPVRLWHDDESVAWTFATDVWMLSSWGVKPWDRHAILWGDDRDRAEASLRRRVALSLQGHLHLNAFRMTEANLAAFAERMERHRPVVVQGYATALDLFASFLLRERRFSIRPRVVRSAAETLSPETRARVEEAFGCPVRDVYGSRESPALAAECKKGGFHVLSHGRLVELVDDAGHAVPAGRPGRVLVTDWTNRAFGLVRYENGDVASWSEDEAPCGCGCPYPRLLRVLGRTSDFVTTPSGERIHGEWFTHLFYGKEGVQKFQVRQRTVTAVDVTTVGPAGEADLAPILEKIRSRLGASVVVTWSSVPEIPPTKTGKHRFTVSDVPFLAGPA